VSKFNNVLGSGGYGPSIDELCVITTELKSVPGVDCRTADTQTNRSLVNCIGVYSVGC